MSGQMKDGELSMKEIRRQIKEKQYHKVYLLTGDEEYLVGQAKNMLKNALVKDGDEMNCTLFENNKIDMNELEGLAFTYPFFSEKRVIIMDRTDILKSGKDAFIHIMENMPDTTCMIISQPEVDKRSKAYKWIKKNGYVGEFLKKNQTEKILLKWIAGMLSKEKKQIRESDARFFLERVGDDMYQIKNETDKLISYMGDRTEITREDIEAISSGEVQNKIFELVSAIAGGNQKQALTYYNDLLLLKEPPMRILFLIVRQYRILLLIKNMRNLRKPDADIARVAGIPAFAIRKNESQLRQYTLEALENCMAECVRMEESIKTGRVSDQMGVELLIIGLLNKTE